MIAQRPQLSLTFGPDRALVWDAGESVRYLVADISANGTTLNAAERVSLNLALAIDVSGSMSGPKLEAARATALAVVDALTPKDRLTLVAFESGVQLLMDARFMDVAGRRVAKNAIARLETLGSTALHGGWEMAANRVAAAMESDTRASHRVLLLTDGQANVGISDGATLGHFAADAQRNGIITSAVGIGDDYDEALLAAMVEAGGGRLHDATDATEIHEVVLGELLEGRSSLVEQVVLRVTIPEQVERAEVVGPWRATRRGKRMEVLVGSLRADQVKRVVIRVFCSAGVAGEAFEIAAALAGQLPDGSAEISAQSQSASLSFADEEVNAAQARDEERSLVALAAWQGAAMREAMQLNRAGRFEEAKSYLRGEITLIKRYARGLDGAQTLLQELELLKQQIAELMDHRLVKEVYVAQMKSGRGERDLRARGRGTVGEMLERKPRTS
jgi:Ca-activated chloride channel family protein